MDLLRIYLDSVDIDALADAVFERLRDRIVDVVNEQLTHLEIKMSTSAVNKKHNTNLHRAVKKRKLNE